MAEDIYRDLQKYLDSMSVGFPATESGVELMILKKIFSEEEAKMYLKMREVPETAQEVAERINENPKTVAEFLAQMAQDGLLFRFVDEGVVRYAVAPFLIGLYENSIQIADRELLELLVKYWDESFTDNISKYPGAFRVIPVGVSVDTLQQVLSYDVTREYIKSKERIAVIECGCRTQRGITEKGCDNPREVCMAFDWYADYLVQNKLGRAVSREEALEIQDRCEEAGLISLRDNAKEGGMGMCHCCKCCCLLLEASKKLPRPVEAFATNFYSAVNADVCTGCETCVDRCQMEAIRIDDDVAVIDRDRCIGCGVCVPTCPVGARDLVQKEKAAEPLSLAELTTTLAQARDRRKSSV